MKPAYLIPIPRTVAPSTEDFKVAVLELLSTKYGAITLAEALGTLEVVKSILLEEAA